MLAVLYLARGDYPSAKRAVDNGLKVFAGYQPMKTAYIEKLLRNRFKARASEAQKLYEAAEKLRTSKKYLEAGRLYAQVLSTYPKDPISHAANFRMGECLVGLARPVQALELWRKFLKDMPAGPWRGQARVASADLLMEQLDLPGSTDHIRQAAAILDNLATLPSPVVGGGAGGEGAAPADHSWQEAAPDIRVRQGILALLAQQDEAAATALKLATHGSRKAAGRRRPLDPLRREKDNAHSKRVGLDRPWRRACPRPGSDRRSHGPQRSGRHALRLCAIGANSKAQPLPKRPSRPSGWPAR